MANRLFRALLLLAPSALPLIAQNALAKIIVDYPADQSVFPPDMAAPTFLWRDRAPGVAAWQITVTFADGATPVHVTAKGEPMQIGEIDPRCVSPANELPKLTPQQAAAHTWKPDPSIWASIKNHSVTGAATISIQSAISQGTLRINTSRDPVGAPIFYRDVPLIPSETEKGVIKPLDESNIPLIAWRLRDIAEPESRVVLEDMHTCANCHSFSSDGKTLGMDLDGPQNDKGLYTLVSVQPKTTIRNRDVISWTSYRGEFGSQLREGFMSQVSPDGRYVVTTIKPPGGRSNQLYYLANFKDYRFLQVFYPTRGILVWYDRETRTLKPLPGADDPRYVHANAVWSPDGKYLVFARAEAKDPFPPDGKLATYANDPKELPIQYDLYRIPFNGGKGGTPEALAGASHNGMSNSFPKISPDGRWIVFVKARNAQLMRPDSKLYIVPARGGAARRMLCNTPLMNSWHSFSPNGRWLVFSSKSRSPYTQLFLTHIDDNGDDSPAILIENSTPANRAANIPEFVNIPASGLLHIDVPAADFYRQMDVASALSRKAQYTAAIGEWIKALAMSPDDPRALNNYGLSLAGAGRNAEAMEQYRLALAGKPDYPDAHNNLAMALADSGNFDEAIQHYREAIAGKPDYAEAHCNLATLLAQRGKVEEAIPHFDAALAAKPNYPDAHNNFGLALASLGKLDAAIGHYRQALAADPRYGDAHNNLGTALAREGKLDEAMAQFRDALEANPADSNAQVNAGRTLLALHRNDEAVAHLRKAVAAFPENAQLEGSLGMALASTDRMDEAISHLERAAALAPGNEEAQLNLARAYGATQQFTLAIAHDEKALDRLPGSAELHSEFGEALVGAQRVDEAITQFRKALELAPGLLDAQYGLGTALMMKGQLAEALAQWRLVLRKDPDHLQTLNDAAWLLATSPDGKLRNGAEALKLAAHAAQLTSGKESAILGTLAAAYAETGQFDRALDVEQRAIQLATERGDATSAGVLQERLVALRAKTPIRQP